MHLFLIRTATAVCAAFTLAGLQVKRLFSVFDESVDTVDGVSLSGRDGQKYLVVNRCQSQLTR
jgi:hypothetical protein